MLGTFGLVLLVVLAACAAPASQPATSEQPAASEDAAGTRVMTVYKSPTCGCCTDWVEYVEEHGYTVEVEMVDDIAIVKNEHNIPQSVWSCHTALVDGYIVEGHVPIAEIERLLTERPEVAGIAVPRMPIGSPGMEVSGSSAEPFDVVTFDASGTTEVFASYPQ
jgi:hypothetical protein